MGSSYLLSPPPMMSLSSVKVRFVVAAGTIRFDTVAAITSSFEVNEKKHHRTAVSLNLLGKKWMLSSTPSAGTVPDLADEAGNSWDLCRQALSSFKFDTQEEDKILGKAYGHIHSPYWGEERAKEVPNYETVNAILNYLRSLTLNDDDIARILKKFPEVLGCSLDNEVKNNVMVLEKEWGITGKALRNLLLRNPKVLGYNVDCKGSCVAQCTRCWVRF